MLFLLKLTATQAQPQSEIQYIDILVILKLIKKHRR